MNITNAAWKHISDVVPNGKVLRLGIRGGGCSGLSYSFAIETIHEAIMKSHEDLIFESDGNKVFIDPKSYIYLKDVTLDYEETLMQSGFKINNPQAVRSCGCGSSFSV